MTIGKYATVDQALEQVELICELIDDEVPEWAQEKAPDFFEDVRAKAAEVGATIEARGEVTPAQITALNNWEDGIRKWIR